MLEYSSLLINGKKAINAAIKQAEYNFEKGVQITRFVFQTKELELICFREETLELRIFAIDQNKILGHGQDNVTVYLSQELGEDNLFAVKVSQEPCNPDYLKDRDILNHIKRLRFFGTVQEFVKKHYLFSTLCLGRTLLDVCYDKEKKHKNILSLTQIYKITISLLEAVHQLHQDCLVLHRDLKLGNIVVQGSEDQNDVTVRLIDFGSACRIQHADKVFTGTIGYQALETMMPKNDEEKPIFTISSDFFSVGVIIAEMLTKENFQDHLRVLMQDWNKVGPSQSLPKDFWHRAMPDVFEMSLTQVEPPFATLINAIKRFMDPMPNKRPIYNKIPGIIKNLTKVVENLDEKSPTCFSEPILPSLIKENEDTRSFSDNDYLSFKPSFLSSLPLLPLPPKTTNKLPANKERKPNFEKKSSRTKKILLSSTQGFESREKKLSQERIPKLHARFDTTYPIQRTRSVNVVKTHKKDAGNRADQREITHSYKEKFFKIGLIRPQPSVNTEEQDDEEIQSNLKSPKKE